MSLGLGSRTNGTGLRPDPSPASASEFDIRVVREAALNVKYPEFGATGSGNSNDTQAFVGAIGTAAERASSLGEQVEVIVPPGVYSLDYLRPKAGVHLNLTEATLKQRIDRGVADGPFVYLPETQLLGDYYGTYDDIKITGGFLDPDGKECHGTFVRMLWTRGLWIDGLEILDYAPPAAGNGLSGTIAMWLGGQNGYVNVRTRRRDYGEAIHNDGLHIVHGQGWRLYGDIESGDDAVVLGGETTASLVAQPDPIRDVVGQAVVDTTRGCAFKAYIPSGADPSDDWAVSDVDYTVVGRSGTDRNGGVALIDLVPGAVAADERMRRITVRATLDVGSGDHDGTNAYGVYLQAAKDCQVEGYMDFTDGSSPFDLVHSRASEDVDVLVKADSAHAFVTDIATSTGIHLIDSLRRQDSNTYTPTLTNTTNIDSSSANEGRWVRVGDVVHVSLSVDVDPTSTGATVLEMSLPVPSNFGSVRDCSGTGCAVGADQACAVRANVANDRAELNYSAASSASREISVIFSYEVI